MPEIYTRGGYGGESSMKTKDTIDKLPDLIWKCPTCGGDGHGFIYPKGHAEHGKWIDSCPD